MHYHQITPAERYMLATLRKQVPTPSSAAIARIMGRHRRTISREIRRNCTPYDGRYRCSRAQEQANGRRSRSRRNSRFNADDWRLIEELLRADLSPEQASGRLRRDGLLLISHETIYTHVWRDKRCGGQLYRRLGSAPPIGSDTAAMRSADAYQASATSLSAHSPLSAATRSATGRSIL